MAAVEREWNYISSLTGLNHTIVLNKSYVTVDGNEPIRLNKLRSKQSNVLESVFQIPVDPGDDVKLCIRGKTPVLAVNGMNMATGEAYSPTKIPGWIWVFYILFVVDFALFGGGVIGGAIGGAGVGVVSVIAANRKMKGVAKVFSCIGAYIGITIIWIIIAIAVNGALSML